MENNERKQNLMVKVEIAKTHNKELNDTICEVTKDRIYRFISL